MRRKGFDILNSLSSNNLLPGGRAKELPAMGGGIADLWSLAEIATLRFKLTHYQFGPA